MQIYFLILACIVIFGLAIAIFLIIKKQHAPSEKTDQNLFLMLQNQIQDLNRLVEQKITDTHKVMSETQTTLNKTIQLKITTNKTPLKPLSTIHNNIILPSNLIIQYPNLKYHKKKIKNKKKNITIHKH
jgi:Mg2+/citrate symporter